MLSDYLVKKLLDHLFGKATFTAPTIYVALSTTDPGEDGTTITEPTDASYARAVTAASDWEATILATRVVTNVTVIDFPASSEPQGDIAYFALYDDPDTGQGNFLWGGTLDAPVTVGTDFVASFDIGALIATIPAT